jgi:hypothetical protein
MWRISVREQEFFNFLEALPLHIDQVPESMDLPRESFVFPLGADMTGSQWLMCSGTSLRTKFAKPKQRKHSTRGKVVLISSIHLRAA